MLKQSKKIYFILYHMYYDPAKKYEDNVRYGLQKSSSVPQWEEIPENHRINNRVYLNISSLKKRTGNYLRF